MLTRTILLACLLCFILKISGQISQVNLLDSASAELFRKIQNSESERAYLTTDRSIYQAGERIWFRAFLLSSVTQTISSNTKTVFVDLVDERDSVITVLLLNAARGQLQGTLALSSSLPSGFYWLRAYTKFMAEHDKTKIFLQPVYVINSSATRESVREHKQTITDSVYLQIFPEGGAIMTGTNSTVAFRVFDGTGQPLQVPVYLKDNRDSTVASSSSDNYGLGKIQFFPKRFLKYAMELTWQGKKYAYPLPPFNFHAGQLSLVSQSDGTLKLRVLLEDSVYKSDFQTYLIGIAGNKIYFASVGRGAYEVGVPEQKFPKGPATFYLLDNAFDVLSERTIYCKGSTVMTRVELDKSIYHKREKANLAIAMNDAEGVPILSSLSIAVSDSNSLRSLTTQEVLGDYFESTSPGINNWVLTTASDLSDDDLDLMMMQKKNLGPPNLNNRQRVFEDSLLYIKGKVIGTNGQPLGQKIVTLFSKIGSMSFNTDTTDAEGRFCFPLEEYIDSTNFNIRISDFRGKAEEGKVQIDSISYPRIVPYSLPKKRFTITATQINGYLRSRPDTNFFGGKNVLAPVTVKGYTKKEVNYDASKRVSHSSKIITSDQFGEEHGAIKNAVLGVAGFQVINGFLIAEGPPRLTVDAGAEPMVLLDGVQVSLTAGIVGTVSPVLSYLEDLNPREVDFIELLSGQEAAVYGSRGGYGAILINTKSSGSTNNFPAGPKNSFWARGYEQPPPFMQPDYKNPKIKSDKLPDERATILWSGNSVTDSSGKVNLSFFTSDIPGTYKVIVRGFTAHGDLIYKTISFRNE